MSVNVSQRK